MSVGRRRTARRTARGARARLLAAPAAAAAVLGFATLVASPGARAADGFDLQVWQPVHDGSGAITAQGVEVLDPWAWRASLSADYARTPLRLVSSGVVLAPLISNATTGELGVTLGLPHRFNFELDVPAAQHKVVNPLAADGSNGVSSTGVGDLRLGAKWGAFDGGDYIPGLAIAGNVTIPSGDGTSWFGSNAVEGRIYGIVQDRLGPVLVVANVGSEIRPRTATVWGKRVGSALTGNGGIVWDTGFSKFQLLVDGYGSYAFRSKEAPVEIGGGVRRELFRGMVATVGANRGVGTALGTPEYRVFGLLSFDSSMFHHAPAPRPVAVARPTPRPTPTPVALLHQTPLSMPSPTPAPTPLAPLVHDDNAAPIVRVTREKIELNQSIHFDLDLWQVNPRSFAILDQVADQLAAHPEISLVRIEGHTDSSGPAFVNDTLSKLRAVSVKNYLVKQGIEDSRLETVGYGPQRPIASNRTKEGRAQNRRVEFNILKRQGDSLEGGAETNPVPAATPAPAVTPKTTPVPTATPKPAATPKAAATPKPAPTATPKPKPSKHTKAKRRTH